MLFGKYYTEEFIIEMPHLSIDDKTYDIYMEKDGWVDRLIEIIEQGEHDIKKILEPFFGLYKVFFIKRYNILDNEQKERLNNVLPDDFLKYMGIGVSLYENVEKIKVYHGTTNKKINDIKNKGLQSPNGYDSASWYMVATDFGSALYHSNADKEAGIMPVVVEFEIPTQKETRKWEGYPYLWPPFVRNGGEKWFALKQELPSKFIKKIHEVDYDAFLKQKKKGF